MAIGDLLAQITGQPSTSSPAVKPALARVSSLPKRKADDGVRRDAPKTPQAVTPQARPVQASRPLDRPNSASKPLSSASKPGILSSKPMNGPNKITKPQPTTRPNPSATPQGATSPAAKAAPKKGSFAEIMARASKAQAVMGQVGKIQHKKVEGGILKKEKEAKAEQRSIPGKRVSGYAGSTSSRKEGPVRSGSSSARDGLNGRSRSNPPEASAHPKLSAKQQAELDREQERKMKKLSQASSYTGTARGKPAAAKRPGGKPMPRGGALLNAPKSRPSKGSRYEDDYDEELDDFIDYDDEEDDFGGGPRYDYASDASSDMEAGLDDIDDEERRAERIAKLEDIEQQRLEERLKMDKEARKRKALEELRARQRR